MNTAVQSQRPNSPGLLMLTAALSLCALLVSGAALGYVTGISFTATGAPGFTGDGSGLYNLTGQPVPSVDSLAQLKALTQGVTVPGSMIYMRRRSGAMNFDSRLSAGMFIWTSANMSSYVAADTQNGIWVPPDYDSDGSSGCWWRQWEGPMQATWFGVIASDGVDDWAAVQGGLNAAYKFGEMGTGSTQRPQSFQFPAGVTEVSTTVTWSGTDLLGYNNMFASSIEMTHPTSGHPILRTSQASYQGIKNLRVRKKSGVGGLPSACLEFKTIGGSPGWTDVGLRVENCAFQSAYNGIVASSGVVNAHFNHIRFDGIHEYAVRLYLGSASGGSFSMDQWTYDNPGGAKGQGIIWAKTTGQGTIVSLSNARVELNSPWVAPKSFIYLEDTDYSETVDFVLSNIQFSNYSGNPINYVLLRDCTNYNGFSSVQLTILHCSQFGEVVATMGGDVSQWTGGIMTGAQLNSAITRSAFVFGGIGLNSSGFTAWTSTNTDGIVIGTIKARSDANLRGGIHSDGSYRMGNGTDAQDAIIRRGGANIVEWGSGDILRPQSNDGQLGDTNRQISLFLREESVGGMPAPGSSENGRIIIEQGTGKLHVYTNGITKTFTPD